MSDEAAPRSESEAATGARELLLQTASDIMREGDIVDISLSCHRLCRS